VRLSLSCPTGDLILLFNSIQFLIFFPITVLGYFLIPKKCKNLWLLIASYIFYMGWNAKYAILLLFSTGVTFFASLAIEKVIADNLRKKTKLILIISLVLIFALLFYYKYLNFSVSFVAKLFSFAGITLSAPKFDIILPVGISFFTFQAAGYLIDVYRGHIKAEHNFLKYALFVSFFPQLVAGPIERSHNLLFQLDKTYTFDFERAKTGIFTMLYGYILKMVIADRASILVDFVYSNNMATGIQIAFATFIFAFQIYCDFAGYSTIAIGASKILGINLMQNFNAPYFAFSFKDFWRRWHISLSTWFRDYLYIPLGGSRKGKFRKNLNTMIVMLVSGVWHGAGMHFVAWGFLNGAFQIFDDLTLKIRERIPKIIQIPITFTGVCLCWLFFRASSLSKAIFYLKKIIFDPQISTIKSGLDSKYGMNKHELCFLLLCIIALMLADFLKYKEVPLKEKLFSKKWYIQSAFFVAAVTFIAVFGVWGAGYNAASFIYFQF